MSISDVSAFVRKGKEKKEKKKMEQHILNVEKFKSLIRNFYIGMFKVDSIETCK